MEHAVSFDTLAYAKKLRSAGISEEQAETQAEALAEAITAQVATRADIGELRREMKEMELRLTIRLGALMTLGISVVATLVKLL